MGSLTRQLALAAFALLLATAPAHADVVGDDEPIPVPPPPAPAPEPPPPPPAAPPAPPEETGWRFLIAPYFWLVGVDGDMNLQGTRADLDNTDWWNAFADDTEEVYAGGLHMEAWNGRFGVILDPFGGALGFENVDTNRGFDVDVDYDFAAVELAGAFRLVGEGPGTFSLDALAGARWFWLDAEHDGPFGLGWDEDRDWVDPFVGMRASIPVSEKLSFLLRGDVGGFDVGTELSWQAFGGLAYYFDMGNMGSAAYLGYRALDQRYSRNSGSSRFSWDTTMHGPVIGMGISF